MGAGNSSPPPSNNSSQEQIEYSEDDLSIISVDDPIYCIDSRPSPLEKVFKVEGDRLYNSDIALIKLEAKISNRQKKKQKCCGCSRCCTKSRSNKMNGIASYDSFNEAYGQAEIFAVKSAEDMLIHPEEVFPLSMVTSLEMTPSQVRSRSKKTRRVQVPEKPNKPMSLWGLVKSAIGKDLAKFPLPVNFGEPLSMLQRLAEDFEYSAILDKANLVEDSLEQMVYVAAFTVSSYASCAYRTAKPFNPLLGETYEFDRTDDYGWRVVAEQVCHHPPIASMHCESALGWVHWQQFTMKSNFRGTYLEIHPLGIAHLRFKDSGNHYTWRKVSTIIRNLYVGKIYIEQEGEMDIINHSTGDRCHLKYTSGGMFSRDRSVFGKVYNRANEAKWEIRGSWDNEILASRLDTNEKALDETTRIYWRKTPLPADAEKQYNFSLFACQLNEPDDSVAPTDSRNRPDQRFMENTLWDEANVEKIRLEDKQREARKARIADGETVYSTTSQLNAKAVKNNTAPSGPDDGIEQYYTPCWFKRQRDPLSGQYIYMYAGEYWDCKENHDWSRCPKIFEK